MQTQIFITIERIATFVTGLLANVRSCYLTTKCQYDRVNSTFHTSIPHPASFVP